MHFEKLLITLLFLISLNCFSQNAISPRIGNEVDKYEREYYGLFPAIKGFHLANTLATQDSSLQVKITRKIDGNFTDTSFQINKDIIRNLAIYIEEFEYCRRGERIINWKLLGGQAAENVPLYSFENNYSNYEIVLREREKLETPILFANDSTIVICKNFNGFNWKNADKDLRLIHFSEIYKMTVIRTGNFWPGVGYGALLGGFALAIADTKTTKDGYFIPLFFSGAVAGAEIGGIVGAIMNIDIEDELNGKEIEYLKLLPDIKRRAVYSAYPPPEVMKLMK